MITVDMRGQLRDLVEKGQTRNSGRLVFLMEEESNKEEKIGQIETR